MKTPDTNAPRRMVLAVQDARLAETLAGLLSSDQVRVVHRPQLTSGEPTDIDADVVVLRAENLVASDLPAVLENAGEGDAPGVLVLGDDEAAADEVRLVAAGATAVIDVGDGRSELASQLVDFARAESEGGVDGPEAGGAVAEPKLADFRSRSPHMRDFLELVKRVATSESTLLITGETGVGKERLARAVHAESRRCERPFVVVNCGALAENLLESELFGHVRGAFTGATGARKGHFEAADGGTILLDEIGEMPAHLQVKLLTVLQRREVQPLGASKPVSVDVRVLAATNRDLTEDVRAGRFREDLLYRLNVVTLTIPPLRERLEDVPLLVGRFVRHFAGLHGQASVEGISTEAMELLLGYDWPGNVRELVNVVERAILVCDEARIQPAHLPSSLGAGRASGVAAATGEDQATLALPLQDARRRVLEDFERRYLEHHLRDARGTLAEVASRAAINPRTLYEKMRRLGLNKEDYR